MTKVITSKLIIYVIIAAFTSTVIAQEQTSENDMALLNQNEKHIVETITLPDGRIIEARTTPSPPNRPPGFEANVVNFPVPSQMEAINVLLDVPAFDWSFGCSATSAAMIAGYFDRHGYTNMYTGPTNDGLMPLDNSSWSDWVDSNGDPRHQCPLSATHNGLDGRSNDGHVDDYWVYYLSGISDPFIGNWAEHTYGDCTGDYMKTNQSNYGNDDGSTTFYNFTNGAPLYWNDMEEYEIEDEDGGYGFKLFYESRGYTVTEMFNQYIDTEGLTYGYTFAQYCEEIDAGRPVMIHVVGHTMVGIGYDDASNLLYIHDTWDYSLHSMTWGGLYSGMRHNGVTVIHLQTSDITVTNGADVSLNFVQTPPSPPETDWPFAQFRLNSDVEGAMLSEITIDLSGSYTGLQGANPFRLHASDLNNFASASAIGSDEAESDGSVSFSGLDDAPLEGLRYYWITVDLSGSASGTISASIANADSLDIMNATFNASSSYGLLNAGGDVSLPVTLSSFTSHAGYRQITLEWTTESEINNDGFIIERATNEDGPFIEIASYKNQDELEGQGTVSYSTDYVFTDNHVQQGITYYYTLISKDFNGSVNTYGNVSATLFEMNAIEYQLYQNYPNPFNSSTIIKFSVPEPSNVTIAIFNVSGQKIAVLIDEIMDAGAHQIRYNADELASGLYFYEITTGDFNQLQKMMLIR